MNQGLLWDWGHARPVSNLAEARAARDRALVAVAEGAPQDWMEDAERTVLAIARRRAEFTADDIWATGLCSPPEPRALGAVMTAAARAGLIARTGRFQATARAKRHAAPIAIWRSLICGDGGSR